MKKLTHVICILILLSSSFCFAKKTKKKIDPKKQAVEELLESLEVNEYIRIIKTLKSKKRLDQVNHEDYKMKKFFSNKKLWYYFDTDNFKRGLERRLLKTFSVSELKQLNKFIKQPFINKILNASILHRDLFTFNKNSLSETYTNPKLQKSRSPLIENLYRLHGMEIQRDDLIKKLKRLTQTGQLTMKILGKSSKSSSLLDTKVLKSRMNDAQGFIVGHFASELTSFRHYEIRDYFRRCRKSRAVQQFVQIYANYHYIYLMQYINKVEQDKIDELKALQVIK